VAAKNQPKPNEPVIENRKARHDYFIEETLECGIELLGTEVKAVRMGRVSLGEGYVRTEGGDGRQKPALTLQSVHIGEFPPAGAARQHAPQRDRRLLAHRREIRKLAHETAAKGVTIIPLKMYFVRGRVKVLIGVARGKQKADKRQTIAQREHQRDMDRAMSRKR
jgi:SsrA-binding protein